MHILENHSAKLLYTLTQLIPKSSLLKLALVLHCNTDETLVIGYESALLGHCINQDIFVKRRVGHSYPMTIRVTWDSSWKARQCVHPSLRSSCLISVVQVCAFSSHKMHFCGMLTVAKEIMQKEVINNAYSGYLLLSAYFVVLKIQSCD